MRVLQLVAQIQPFNLHPLIQTAVKSLVVYIVLVLSTTMIATSALYDLCCISPLKGTWINLKALSLGMFCAKFC